MITDDRAKWTNCCTQMTRRECKCFGSTVDVCLYLRQYLLFLISSRVGSREEFFQSRQCSTGFCYFFVGACPTKLLPIDLHLTGTHTYRYISHEVWLNGAVCLAMPRCQAGMLSISRAMKQSGVTQRKHTPPRTARLQGPSWLINSTDDQHVCVAYLVSFFHTCGSTRSYVCRCICESVTSKSLTSITKRLS